jgi:signal transduction histidine kinase
VFILAGAPLIDMDGLDDIGPVVTGVLLTLLVMGGVGVVGRRTRASTTQAAVQEERRRISRELHDIVGHGLLVVALYARRLPGMAPQARSIALAIDETAQSTLREVRRLVGVLRMSSGPDDAADPTPVSSRIIDLTARLPYRRLSVVLDRAEREHLVPPQLRTTMLRVVQEGLTNALKYSQDKPVQVSLRFDDEVLLTVASGASATAEPRSDAAGTGDGYGLSGLRERVVAEGGSFESGPTGDGFLIRARIPVPALRNAPEDGEREWIPSAS